MIDTRQDKSPSGLILLWTINWTQSNTTSTYMLSIYWLL